MIERGRIVALEDDAYWVETISASGCGSCAAQKGCGQGLLAEYFGERSNHLRVLIDGPETRGFQLHDEIEFDVADRVLLSSAFVVYTLPLLSLLACAALADVLWSHTAAAPLGAATGFVIGLLPAWLASRLLRNDRRMQPVVLGRVNASAAALTQP